MIFEKGAKNTKWAEKSLSTNGDGEIVYPQAKKNETRPLSYRYTKIYSKQIKDLNVRLETVKLLEDTKGKAS